MTGWKLLAVDDEPLSLQELIYQLRKDPRVGEVLQARDGLQALRSLRSTPCDAVFLDVSMPGLDGVDLAGVLDGQVSKPVIVFVSAHDTRAAEAFGLDAVDYVLKPLRGQRITEALDRVERRLAGTPPALQAPSHDLATIAVDDGRRIFFVRRDDVLFAEAQRDHVNLHTRGTRAGVHTVRLPLSSLEAAWEAHGFLRVHRSYLVALRHVSELTRDPLGGQLVRVGGHDLPVSRRQAAVLRDRIRRLGHSVPTALGSVSGPQ